MGATDTVISAAPTLSQLPLPRPMLSQDMDTTAMDMAMDTAMDTATDTHTAATDTATTTASAALTPSTDPDTTATDTTATATVTVTATDTAVTDTTVKKLNPINFIHPQPYSSEKQPSHKKTIGCASFMPTLHRANEIFDLLKVSNFLANIHHHFFLK